MRAPCPRVGNDNTAGVVGSGNALGRKEVATAGRTVSLRVRLPRARELARKSVMAQARVQPVPYTDYHAKYFAYELTKRCPSDSLEKLAGAVAGAQVDLNPHQIDAALFAFRSPLSRGALLVVCSAFRGKKDGYPNLTVKKIPAAVLGRCEWGKDDYSLKVENLPKASPPAGQQELDL